MGIKLSMEKELTISREASSAAYQLARGELGRLQGQHARTDVEAKILDDGLMAYDLESMLRGYTERISRGEIPSAKWLDEIQGAWKFYKSETALSYHENFPESWPAISLYEKAVIEFERVVISYVNKRLNL
jgi:hypothetical protein